MRTRILSSALLIAFLSAAPLAVRAQSSGSAQAKPEQHFLKLDFVVREVDPSGKVVNARSYTSSTVTGDEGFRSIRTGSRVPVRTSDGNGGANVQYQYIDAGVNIDFGEAMLTGNEVSISVKGDVSSFAKPSEEVAGSASLKELVIRQNKWDATVLVPLGKPTIIFSSDDVTTRNKMQMELTATMMK
jgi:hypothetical protein